MVVNISRKWIFILPALLSGASQARALNLEKKRETKTNDLAFGRLLLRGLTLVRANNGLLEPYAGAKKEDVNVTQAKDFTRKASEILSRRDPKAGTRTAFAMGVDVLLMLATGLSRTIEAPAKDCPLFFTFTTLVLWWSLGFHVLINDHSLRGGDTSLLPSEAIQVLSQQYTSVGYGSHVPSGEDELMQMFHVVHGWVGTALVSGYVDDLVQKALDCVEFMLATGFDQNKMDGINPTTRLFLNTVMMIVTTLMYAGAFTPELAVPPNLTTQSERKRMHDGFLQALYVMIFTGTSTGYGDVAPSSLAGMGSGIIWMPLLVGMYARFAALLGGANNNAVLDDWHCGVDESKGGCQVGPIERGARGRR